MQAYIPEFILAGLAMILLLAETFFKKAPKFVFGLIGAAGALAMLPFYMESLYANTYIILALVATAITLLLSVDFRAVINLSSNDSKTQDGTGEFYILPLLACVGSTAVLSVASKVAGFALLSIILAPFAGIPAVQFVIALMAAATLLVGNLGAIPQTNLKRLMGYSSIAQAGFILPLFIGTVKGQLAPNAPFYLAVYLVMTFGAFFALAMIRTQRGSEEISAFRGLGKTNPRLALAITIMFASLAGVPLTAGFFAKMISFVHVINTGLYLNWMLPIMIICAAAGFYYYFKVIRSMYWDKPEEGMEAVQVPVISGVMLAAFSVFIVIGGLMPLFINPIR